MKVYKIEEDCTAWVVAENEIEAKTCYLKEGCDGYDVEIDSIKEVTEVEMESTNVHDDYTGKTMSMKAFIDRYKFVPPQVIAHSEW